MRSQFTVNTGNNLYTQTHSEHVFLTSVTRLSCISTVTLAVSLAQARHSTFAMFTARQTAGVSCILVLLITEYTSKTRLATTGVGVGVDWKAGTMNTPEDGGGRDSEDEDVNAYTNLPAIPLFEPWT